jgi:hypothetical protein
MREQLGEMLDELREIAAWIASAATRVAEDGQSRILDVQRLSLCALVGRHGCLLRKGIRSVGVCLDLHCAQSLAHSVMVPTFDHRIAIPGIW